MVKTLNRKLLRYFVGITRSPNSVVLPLDVKVDGDTLPQILFKRFDIFNLMIDNWDHGLTDLHIVAGYVGIILDTIIPKPIHWFTGVLRHDPDQAMLYIGKLIDVLDLPDGSSTELLSILVSIENYDSLVGLEFYLKRTMTLQEMIIETGVLLK